MARHCADRRSAPRCGRASAYCASRCRRGRAVFRSRRVAHPGTDALHGIRRGSARRCAGGVLLVERDRLCPPGRTRRAALQQPQPRRLRRVVTVPARAESSRIPACRRIRPSISSASSWPHSRSRTGTCSSPMSTGRCCRCRDPTSCRASGGFLPQTGQSCIETTRSRSW